MEKELMEKKNDLITRAETVLNQAKAEKRELTDAEAQELAEIRDDVRRIMETLKIKKDFAEMEDRKPTEEIEVEKEVEEERKCKETRALEEEKAFEGYLRGIVLNERANNLTFGDNGAVVPETIANRIIKKVYDICPILEKSSKYNVKGTFDIPYYDESTTSITVAYQNEFSALSSNVGEFTTISLSGYLAGALVLVSRSLINNSKFDIIAFVIDEMAYHIAMFIEGELLNGTENKVQGLSALTNKLQLTSASAITGDDLVNLQAKVKDVYQDNAIWIMSTATRTAIRSLKDEMGRYLLQDDISLPFGKSLLGKPVYVSDNMPEIGDGNTVIYYGDMRGLATKFSEDINIQVLREKYADQHAVGVVGWLEFDSKVEDAQKIARLVMGNGSH